MVIHEAPLDADHGQPADVVTDTVPLLAPAPTDWEEGEMPYAQPSVCVTATVCPATVSDACRAVPEFAAMVKATFPGPLPLAPSVMVIHDAPLALDHAQPCAVCTVTLPDPPEFPALWKVGSTV